MRKSPWFLIGIVTMDLPSGITGIRDPDIPSQGPVSNLPAFRAHCHQAARIVGATVESIQDPGEAGTVCNYAIARVRFSDMALAILLNAVYPILAFARLPGPGQVVFEFLDCPKLADAFRTLGDYKFASSEELHRPLVRDLCKNLSPVELKRVRYFRPARIGDVIFNYWD